MSPVVLVHRSPHDLVAIKPAGLPSELSRNAKADSLLVRLRAQSAEAHAVGDAPRLVHRLDSLARGLVLVALTRDAAAYYGAEVAAGRWDKFYLARIVEPIHGAPDALCGPHKAFLKDRARLSELVRAGGKPSFLRVLATAPAPGRPGERHALIQLLTGRRHQIRVMMAGLGAPLVGDMDYGGPSGPPYLEHAVLRYRDIRDRAIVSRHLAKDPDREPLDAQLTTRLSAIASTLELEGEI